MLWRYVRINGVFYTPPPPNPCDEHAHYVRRVERNDETNMMKAFTECGVLDVE